jgi:hypothetical protein
LLEKHSSNPLREWMPVNLDEFVPARRSRWPLVSTLACLAMWFAGLSLPARAQATTAGTAD